VYPIAIQSGRKQTHFAALLCALRSHVSFRSPVAFALFNSKEREEERKNDEAENFCGIFPGKSNFE
jgi:hypothetical protein